MSSITLSNVSINYHIFQESTLKEKVLNSFHRGKLIHPPFEIQALKNVTLSISDGTRLGIIGPNGAGKSTLLKTISGIYPPSTGSVHIDGTMACLFELATGFEMEASGWDNIMLRGMMLGQSPQKMRKIMDEIASFSELNDFLDMPVKYYSSGMFIRLAFSISTAIAPDILLLDEVVAAGDAKFLKKATQRLDELLDKVKILVYVSHSMKSIKDFCNTCIWIDKGEIRLYGEVNKVVSEYLKFVGV